MFTEFDAESLKRAGMQAGQKSFHNKPGAQIQPRNIANH